MHAAAWKTQQQGKKQGKIDKNGERMREKIKHTGKKVCVICDFCPFCQLMPLLTRVFTYKKAQTAFSVS